MSLSLFLKKRVEKKNDRLKQRKRERKKEENMSYFSITSQIKAVNT